MKKRGIALVAAIAVLFVGIPPAHAWVRVWVGGPFLYPYPYYAPPPVVVQPSAPVVVPPSPPQTSYWYYCESSKGYYPYVKECPGGWTRVVPNPAP